MKNKTPEGWISKKIMKLGEVHTGNTPSTANREYYENGNELFIGPKDLSSSTIIKDSVNKITKKGLDVSRKIPPQSILVSCVGNIGKTGITVKESACNQQINYIIPNIGIIDPTFLLFLMDYSKKRLNSMATKQVLDIVNKSSFENLSVIFPESLGEQKKIAEILSKVDEVTNSIENYIHKLEQLKKGLMNNLILKGVNDHEMKKSIFGEIPQSWSVVRLDEIGESIIGLTYSPSDIVEDHGTIVLRSPNVSEDNYLSLKNIVMVNKKIKEKLLVQKNDILICTRNGSQRLIGKSTILDDPRVIGHTFGAFMGIYRSEYNEYISLLFNSDIIKNQIRKNLGSTINQITNSDLNSFKIPLPQSKSEMLDIISKIKPLNKLIKLKMKELDKNKQLKQALMQELLTGKKRVKVDK